MSKKVIAVFGSSKLKTEDAAYRKAVLLGEYLARARFIVASGGYGGIMEAVSKGAKQAGGKTLGITTAEFSSSVNEWVDEEISQTNWRERLFALIDMADGFVLCRGGTGTLVEFSCIWELAAKGLMKDKPMVIYDEFWNGLIFFLQGSSEFKRETPFWSCQDPSEVVRYLDSQLRAVNLK